MSRRQATTDGAPKRSLLGHLAQQEREAAGLTQRNLGLALGYNPESAQSKVSLFEKGGEGFEMLERKLNELAEFERALGLQRGHFLVKAGWVNPPTSTVDMILMDPRLAPAEREMVVRVYRASVVESKRPARKGALNDWPTADGEEPSAVRKPARRS